MKSSIHICCQYILRKLYAEHLLKIAEKGRHRFSIPGKHATDSSNNQSIPQTKARNLNTRIGLNHSYSLHTSTYIHVYVYLHTYSKP